MRYTEFIRDNSTLWRVQLSVLSDGGRCNAILKALSSQRFFFPHIIEGRLLVPVLFEARFHVKEAFVTSLNFEKWSYSAEKYTAKLIFS